MIFLDLARKLASTVDAVKFLLGLKGGVFVIKLRDDLGGKLLLNRLRMDRAIRHKAFYELDIFAALLA